MVEAIAAQQPLDRAVAQLVEAEAQAAQLGEPLALAAAARPQPFEQGAQALVAERIAAERKAHHRGRGSTQRLPYLCPALAAQRVVM